jgi:hypothetical protein
MVARSEHNRVVSRLGLSNGKQSFNPNLDMAAGSTGVVSRLSRVGLSGQKPPGIGTYGAGSRNNQGLTRSKRTDCTESKESTRHQTL